MDYKEDPIPFLSKIAGNGLQCTYVAALVDTEGCVGIYGDDKYQISVVNISNKNRKLLDWAQGILGGSISHSNTVYQLQLWGEEAIDVLRKLPLSHQEKVSARDLILHHADYGGIRVEALGEFRRLRRRIDEEVRSCTMLARLDWIRRHGRPHPKDPDQTSPEN